jgi:O-antigen/teichoic acid export membrane protein
LLSQVGGALTNLVLNLILIPDFGAIGAAYATLFSYFTASIVSLLFFNHTRSLFLTLCKSIVTVPKLSYLRKLTN